MNVLYHLTDAPPRIPDTDAVYQDVAALERRFGGDRVHLYPFRRRGMLLRLERLAGVQMLPRLRRLDRCVQLHHVFAGSLNYYPALRALRRPIVYTAVAGMEGVRAPPTAVRRLVRRIVVASRRNLGMLQDWGFDNVSVIRPGIDVDRFCHRPVPRRSGFVLLAGSAPWVKEQFASKGFDALFALAARRTEIRLILLWRGLLERELTRRLEAYGLQERVEVVREKADVNALLGRAHGVVVLAEHAHLIKEYPHSLMESLVVGRPVVVSQCIAMADYVREKSCGVVVPEVTEDAVSTAVDRLIDGYDGYQQRARDVGRKDFCLQAMLEGYREVYESCGYMSRG